LQKLESFAIAFNGNTSKRPGRGNDNLVQTLFFVTAVHIQHVIRLYEKSVVTSLYISSKIVHELLKLKFVKIFTMEFEE